MSQHQHPNDKVISAESIKSLLSIALSFDGSSLKYPHHTHCKNRPWHSGRSQIFRDLSNPVIYFAYAAGFATGTFVGMWLEDRLSIGTVMIRVVTQKEADELINQLKQRRYGVTIVHAMGALGAVQTILTIVQRTSVPEVVSLVKQFNPHAFYTIEDVRDVTEGIFPIKGDGFLKQRLRPLFALRKGK